MAKKKRPNAAQRRQDLTAVMASLMFIFVLGGLAGSR